MHHMTAPANWMLEGRQDEARKEGVSCPKTFVKKESGSLVLFDSIVSGSEPATQEVRGETHCKQATRSEESEQLAVCTDRMFSWVPNRRAKEQRRPCGLLRKSKKARMMTFSTSQPNSLTTFRSGWEWRWGMLSSSPD